MSLENRYDAYAFGKTHFTCGNCAAKASARNSQPRPESPSPCNQMTVAVCFSVGWTTIGFRNVGIVDSLLALHSNNPTNMFRTIAFVCVCVIFKPCVTLDANSFYVALMKDIWRHPPVLSSWEQLTLFIASNLPSWTNFLHQAKWIYVYYRVCISGFHSLWPS